MKWLFAFGLILSAGLAAGGSLGEYEQYMEQFLDSAMFMVKNKLDKDGRAWTMDLRGYTKENADGADGYLFNMDFDIYGADSEEEIETKKCQASVHFFFDGKSDPKITKGPDCKTVS